ncbi:MAG TPA: hypothetical protein VFZ64_02725 [Nocardioidaceae bacterium]
MSSQLTGPAVDRLSVEDVSRLVAASAWPSVSLLVDTAPRARMSREDAARLEGLVAEAERRLQASGVVRTGPLMALLRTLALEAAAGPTGRALGLFVSQALARRVSLPVTVTPRVVVESTFATRDLVLALHRTPPHLLLLLHASCAHLFRGYADTLVPLAGHGFPLTRSEPRLGVLDRGEDGLEQFLADVDTALRRARQAHPSPLVLAGAEPVVSAFGRRSRNLHRLAATLTGPSVETLGELHLEARTGLEAYLLSRHDEALTALEQARRTRPHDVCTGVGACWDAVRRARPGMLVVEEGFSYPARVDGGRLLALEGTGLAEDAQARHDVVDDLIEAVIMRGGWVAFARDGALRSDGRVALVLQRGEGR